MEIIKTEANKKFSMKVVSNRTGLSAHVIRAWERRYNAVTPGRDENNRRFYDQSDVDRLLMLKMATDAGFPISQVANYSEDDLKELVDNLNVIELPVSKSPNIQKEKHSSPADVESYIESFIAAAEQMDSRELENIMVNAETELGINSLLENMLIPLLERIGELWRGGKLRIANEHMASHVIRTYLSGMLGSHNTNPSAPGIVVSTPVDQWHDLGSLITAVIASTEGWDVNYLGASLPAEEIAGAVRFSGSKVVALSLIYPAGDPVVVQELKKLKRALSKDVSIIVNGRAKDSYEGILDEIGAIYVENMSDLRTKLESLR